MAASGVGPPRPLCLPRPCLSGRRGPVPFQRRLALARHVYTYTCIHTGTPWPAKNDGRVVVRALLRNGLQPDSVDPKVRTHSPDLEQRGRAAPNPMPNPHQVRSYATQWGAKMLGSAQEQQPPNASGGAVSSSCASQHAPATSLPLAEWPCSPDSRRAARYSWPEGHG